MRATSVESWVELQPDLGKAQRRVRDFVEAHPGRTATEIDQVLGVNAHWRRTANKRLSELERRGSVIAIGTRACTITGRNALIWFIASRGGVTPIRCATRAELIETLAALATAYDHAETTGLLQLGATAHARALLTREVARRVVAK